MAFNLLANGMGGVDWAGLPFVVEHLGIMNVEGLMDAILLIKTHKPPQES